MDKIFFLIGSDDTLTWFNRDQVIEIQNQSDTFTITTSDGHIHQFNNNTREPTFHTSNSTGWCPGANPGAYAMIFSDIRFDKDTLYPLNLSTIGFISEKWWKMPNHTINPIYMMSYRKCNDKIEIIMTNGKTRSFNIKSD
jgi:hypothetical protein